MPIFRKHAYRWRWGTLWTNLWHYPSDFGRGVQNWFRWAPVIWQDADFDWDYLGTILEYKFDRMARSMDRGIIVNNERYARQIRECRDLVHRLVEDQYFENAQLGYSEISPHRTFLKTRHAFADTLHAMDMHKQDQQRLGLLLSKYMTHWWW
jgi:hypothetical protein